MLSKSDSDEEDTFKDEEDKEVRFENIENEMDFSPPRIPKHSPSYLIWSIFTKEREERQRRKRTKSPLSQVQMKSSEEEDNFENILLNSKMTELQNEIEKFKKENSTIQGLRRKIEFGQEEVGGGNQ